MPVDDLGDAYWYFTEPTIESDGTRTLKISFWPIPDTSYTVTYSYKKTTSLTSASVYPFFDTAYHHILSDYAIWQYAVREPDPTLDPNYFKNEWLEGLAMLKRKMMTDSKHQITIPGPDQYEHDQIG